MIMTLVELYATYLKVTCDTSKEGYELIKRMYEYGITDFDSVLGNAWYHVEGFISKSIFQMDDDELSDAIDYFSDCIRFADVSRRYDLDRGFSDYRDDELVERLDSLIRICTIELEYRETDDYDEKMDLWLDVPGDEWCDPEDWSDYE